MANYGKNVKATEDTKVVDEVASTPKVEPRPKKKAIDKSEEVACRSIVSGDLIYISRRSNETIEWNGYGDIQYISVEELMTMKSQQKAFLNRPWIIIEDDDIVDHLGLRSIYEGILPVDDIESFLLGTDASEMAEIIRKTPKGVKELLVDKARELVASERLDSMRLIKVLNEELNIDLTMIQD